MNTQQQSRPVITPAMREQAAKQPNSWLYVVDPIFTDPGAEIPPWGFIGGYRVDERGQLTDDFSPNPNYRPSPVALRLPAPNNDLERALQLTTTGYAQGQTLLMALLDAEVILFAQPQGSGLFTMEHESGRRQLQMFTSDAYLPSNWTTWQHMTGRALANQRPTGLDLQINPTSPIKARVPGEDLIKAAGLTPQQAPETAAGVAKVPPALSAAPTNGSMSPVGEAQSTTPPDADGQAANGQTPAPQQQQTEQPSAPQQPEPESSQPAQDPVETERGQRFLGSMLAGAVADALGAGIEFYPVDQIRSRYGERGVTDYDRTGGRPGEFTDDTQMTLFTTEGLIRGHIAVRKGIADSPLPAVQLAYQRWLHTQGYAWTRASGPFAERHPDPTGWLIKQRDLFAVRSPNSTCITALREFASVGAPATFQRPINEANDCGGVVRAAPVALWSDEPKEVFELAAATAALTYSDPNGYLPAGAQAVLVQQLLRGESLGEALRRTRALLVGYAGHEDLDRLLQAADDLAQQGKPTPEQLKDTLGAGWTGHEALAIAVCAALSTETVASAVMLAINHSGDSDSTGAICGHIVGALHGSASLPGVWLRDLQQRDTIETLAMDALIEFSSAPSADPGWLARYPADQDFSDLEFVSALPSSPTGTRQLSARESSASESAQAPRSTTSAESAVPPERETSSGPAPTREFQTRERQGRDAKILGCLLGGATGDALGYPIETESLETIRAKYGASGVTDFVDAYRPGGSISDDTQMTLFTLEGLVRAGIRRRLRSEPEPAADVQQAYQRWLHTQGFDWKEAGGPLGGQTPDGWLIRQKGLFVRRAPGTTCIQALHGYASGQPLGSFTRRVNQSQGRGGVMRAAPAGFWSDDPTEAFRVGAVTAALTHGHPAGFLPAGALAVIVQQLLAGRSLPEAVDRALTELSTWDEHEGTSAALRKAIEMAATTTPTPEEIQERLGSGEVGEQALAIAVCAALTHATSFSAAVSLAANHSGNSDTTAAICGNIMGAANGVHSIPPAWREKVELRSTIEELAHDAVREFGPTPPTGAEWLERYPASPASNPADQSQTDASSRGSTASGAAEAVEAAQPSAPIHQDSEQQASGQREASAASEQSQEAAQDEAGQHAHAQQSAQQTTESTPAAAEKPGAQASTEQLNLREAATTEATPSSGNNSASSSGPGSGAATPQTDGERPTAAESVNVGAATSPAETDVQHSATTSADAATSESSGDAASATASAFTAPASSGASEIGRSSGAGDSSAAGSEAASNGSARTPTTSEDSPASETTAAPASESAPAPETAEGTGFASSAVLAGTAGLAGAAVAAHAVSSQSGSAKDDGPQRRDSQQPARTESGSAEHADREADLDNGAFAEHRQPVQKRETTEKRETTAGQKSPESWADSDERSTSENGQLPDVGTTDSAGPAAGATAVAASTAIPAQPATAEQSAAPEQPGTAQHAGDSDDALSDEELRLLAAWRKFREGDEDTPSDLSQGLRKLLVEAFGAERAAQLVGDAQAEATDSADAEEAPETSPARQLTREQRLEGCVLGGAVGDALAAPWKFASLHTTLRNNPDGVRDYTEHFGKLGSATALGQQSVFVLDGLLRASIHARLRGVAADTPSMVRLSLQHWVCTQGARFDPALPVGLLTESAVLREQRFPDETSLVALTQARNGVPTPGNPPNDDRGATAVLRGALAGFHADAPEEAVSLGSRVAALTHGHPDSHLAAGALGAMVVALCEGRTLAESARGALTELKAFEGGENTAQALRSALDLVGRGPVTPTALEELGDGWTGPEALAIAVTAALAHPDDVADAVSLAATHSGNSVATAAVCGSLVGAARGAEDLPAEWLRDLELADVLRQLLADDARVADEIRSDQAAPDWANRYIG